jgi:hypothetical protein
VSPFVDLNQFVKSANRVWAVHVVDYPEEWRMQIRVQHCLADDPVPCACQRSAAAFRGRNRRRSSHLGDIDGQGRLVLRNGHPDEYLGANDELLPAKAAAWRARAEKAGLSGGVAA